MAETTADILIPLKCHAMFRHTIPVGRVFGISVDASYSCFVLVGLLTWISAVSYYPSEFQDWSAVEYWCIGFLSAILLFVSVLIHELGHSVVAKSFGLSVPRIRLFVFGGISELAAEPRSAAAEFCIAALGPIVSFALAALFWEIEPLLTSEPLFGVAKYLAYSNLMLGVFNLIPGFPLDGGRVLRAIVWQATGNDRRATTIAALAGRLVGLVLVFMGVWQVLLGNLIGGMWTALIGWFLESAAQSQLRQSVLKAALADHKVVEAMTRDFPEVSGNLNLQDLVDRHVLRSGFRYFVVGGESGTIGLLTLDAIQRLPRSEWPVTKAAQVMKPLQRLAATRPGAGLWSALEKMARDGVNDLPLVEDQGIVGMLTRRDIVHYLQVLRAFAR